MIGYLGRCSSGACPFTASPKRGLIFGALFGLLLALSYGCERSGNTAFDRNPIEGGLFIENSADFQELVVKATMPIVVNFYSPTCSPCRKLAPTIASLKEKYSGIAEVYKVDVLKFPELTTLYHIESVPTVCFFVDGREVDRIVGNNNASAYEKVIERLKSTFAQE